MSTSREEKEQTNRSSIRTPNIRYYESQTQQSSLHMQFGLKPYETLHLKKLKNINRKAGNQKSQTNYENYAELKEALYEPYRRISKVGDLIQKNRQQMKKHSDAVINEQFYTTNYSLRPHFKIKTNKSFYTNSKLRENIPECSKTVHFKNLSLECSSYSSPRQIQKSSHITHLQQVVKNRMKLHRKNTSKKQQVSLIGMLNKISNNTPLLKFKSREVEKYEKVKAFVNPNL